MTARERELIQRWRRRYGDSHGFKSRLTDETVYHAIKNTLHWRSFCLAEALKDCGRAVIKELHSFTTWLRK